jgi:2'-5' RNA ligase
MSLLRAFIAVDIPSEIRQKIHDNTESLRNALGALVRWTPQENIHLTLKFLGNTSQANVEFVIQMMRAEVDSCAPFDMRIGGIGSFPNLGRPRVIYIGIQAPAALGVLQRGIESASRRLGYEPEEHGFSAHLTIGRVKQRIPAAEQQKIRRALEGAKIDFLGIARVDSVHFYKSDLKPTGSVYTRLYSAPLRKSP